MTTDPVYHRLSRPFEAARGFYTFMLLEDASRAFPYASFRNSFTAEAVTESGEDVTELAAEALTRERSSGRNRAEPLVDAIRDFGEECIRHMLMFGEAAYELVLCSPDEVGRWRRFDLRLIHPYWRRLGRHYHYMAAVGEETEGRTVTLPPESVIVFRLEPPARRREVADAVAVLRAASGLTTAATELMMSGVGFDLTQHRRAEEAILARATRTIGWTGRDAYMHDALEPYRTIRELRFRLFQAELRTMVLSGVQEALNRAGRSLGFAATIHVSSLPDRQSIEDAIHLVERGVGDDETLWDVLKPFV
jgi:hypothetical protein